MTPRGLRSLDIEIQAFLDDGFEYIRANPDVFTEIFKHFQEPHLEKLYGNREVDRVKKWFLGTHVPVIQSWNLGPSRVPCVSIHLAASSEATQYSYFGDHAETNEEIDASQATVIVDDFVPAAYDSTTGVITINPDTTDISNIRPNYILVDASGEAFLIIPVIDLENNFFTIDITEGSGVDVRSLHIQDGVGVVKKKHGQSEFMENIDLGIHGKDDNNTVLWMYYIIVWLLFRFKATLEERGIDIHTFSASEFDRQSKFVEENIYSRWIRLVGKTTVEWSEDKLPIATTFDLTLDAEVNEG
jgi:hypothetical protein